jgi:hypothetical protein
MPLWNVVLMFVLLVGLVAYQLYKSENREGFTAGIRHKIRPLLRNMRLKREAMTKNIKRRYERFRR